MAAAWWQMAGLTGPPSVADAVLRPRVSLFQLLQIALLEQGEPMAEETIAQRLAALGVSSERTDLVTALVKAWHGLAPVRRLPDGRLGIDPNDAWLSRLPWRLGLVPFEQARTRTVAEEPPIAPPATVQISQQECDALLACNGLAGLSDVRVVAAILEAHGSAMSLDAINSILRSATGGRGGRSELAPKRLAAWREPYVLVQPGASLRLGEDPRLLMAMREDVRKRAYVLLRQQEKTRQAEAWRASRHQAASAAVRTEAASTSPLRRLVVRAYPGEGLPRALSVLDPVKHVITTLIDASTAAMAAILADADLVVGLEPESTLAALGLERRTADLSRHPRTRQLNRRGRSLRISTAQLISASVGISRPLYNPAVMRRYLADGSETALRRRLESDVKALAAFYRFGRLHGFVRLRWGFLDELRRVEWPGSPGDPLHALVQAAVESNAEIEVVSGSAPGWAEPWSRAMHGRPSLDYHSLRLQTRQGLQDLPRQEIQAVRLCHAEAVPHPAARNDRSDSPPVA
jgi:hypothetical protein